VEHGIRPAEESRGDAEFVRSLCKQLKVPCRIVHIPPGKIADLAAKRGMGIEAAARQYRRRIWFKEASRIEDTQRLEAAGGQARILTAHTEDDMLETLLMRILRGAGPSGLAAMPPSRGRILRPLLAVSRSDVIAYLGEKKLSWREDSTNADLHFFRNRVRHRLAPLLDGDFPRWRKTLALLGETQSLAADFIEKEAAVRICWGVGSGSSSLYTNAENFFAQPAIIREEALFQGIDSLLALQNSGGNPLSVRRSVLRRFCAETIPIAADLGPVRIRRDSQQVTISPSAFTPHSSFLIPHPSSENGFSLLINMPGFYAVKGITIEVCESPADGTINGNSFFALLPLVLRPCLKNDSVGKRRADKGCNLTATDSCGPVAFIGQDGGLICRRDETGSKTQPAKLWMVKVMRHLRR